MKTVLALIAVISLAVALKVGCGSAAGGRGGGSSGQPVDAGGQDEGVGDEETDAGGNDVAPGDQDNDSDGQTLADVVVAQWDFEPTGPLPFGSVAPSTVADNVAASDFTSSDG